MRRAEWLFVLQPALNCHNCTEIKRRTGKPRACDTPKGCEIEDVAADVEIHHFLERYIGAKALFQSTGLASLQERIFTELGLMDDLDTLMALEILWCKKLAIDRQKEAQRCQSKKSNLR